MARPSRGSNPKPGPIRLGDFFQPQSRRLIPKVRSCSACGQPTKEGKSYCIDHLHLLAYASKVWEQQEEITKELSRVSRGGKIPEGSLVVATILKTLSIEEMPLRELADQTDVPFGLIGVYIQRMEKIGLVDVRPTPGKTRIVSQASPKQVLSTKLVAKEMGVSRDTVTFWVTKGLPIYHKGKRGQESLFDLSIVKQWYVEFKKKDSANRRAQTKADWSQVYQLALAQGVDAAATRFGLNKNVVRRKIHAMGAPVLAPVSHRTITVTEAANHMGVYPVTVFKWITQGAPHDRLIMAHKKRARLLVNLTEIKEWRQAKEQALKEMNQRKATEMNLRGRR